MSEQHVLPPVNHVGGLQSAANALQRRVSGSIPESAGGVVHSPPNKMPTSRDSAPLERTREAPTPADSSDVPVRVTTLAELAKGIASVRENAQVVDEGWNVGAFLKASTPQASRKNGPSLAASVLKRMRPQP